MDQQLKKIAQDMFNANPTVEMFLVSSDNQFWIPDGTNAAQSHQAQLNRPTEANTQLLRISKDMAFAEDKEEEGADSDIPTEKSTVKELAAYLTEKGVELTGKEKKPDLLAKLAELSKPADVTVPDANSMDEVIVEFLISKGVEADVAEGKEALLAKLSEVTKPQE